MTTNSISASTAPFDEDFVADLRCPQCDAALIWQTDESQLRCNSEGCTFKIVDGIPRFVDDQHLASFGLQWNKYDVAHNDEDRVTFQAKTGLSLAKLDGLRVLDAGCGGGRYSRVAAEAGAQVVAADHTNAVDRAARLCDQQTRVQFVQADLKRLPLQPASFDAVFSIGVMHHDAHTRDVFDAVSKMVKPGGKLSVWLYRRNRWWQERLNSALRRRTVEMPIEKLERWCKVGAWLGGLPVINKTLNKLVNFSNHPSAENRVCDTFDWYAPEYQHHHTTEELCDWFHAAGFDNLVVLAPEKTGQFYRWSYEQDLLIGSGVNVQGTRRR